MVAAAIVKRRKVDQVRKNVPDLSAVQGLKSYRTVDQCKLPGENEFLREGILKKRSVTAKGAKWLEKRVVLLKDKLVFCPIDDGRYSEHIPLAEIETVDILAGNMTHFAKSAMQRTLDKTMSKKSLNDSGDDALSTFTQTRKDTTKPRLEIVTDDDGYNGGRRYALETKSEEDLTGWISAIEDAVGYAKAEARKALRLTAWNIYQERAKAFHNSPAFQFVMASIIIALFINSIVSSELQPESGSSAKWTIETLGTCIVPCCDVLRGSTTLPVLNTDFIMVCSSDTIFTVMFAVELLLHASAEWFWEFWTGEQWGWNWFDVAVVTASLLSLASDDEDSKFAVLRLIRILRAVKLLRSFKSLNKIVSALTAAILPVCNAMMILGVVTSIYAIIGVTLFGDRAPGQFGRFSYAMFTMFQVLTGDGWATAVTRPLFGPNLQDPPTSEVTLFFVSYMIVAAIFVLNVVIAVLLDKFIDAVERDKHDEKMAEQAQVLETTMERGTALDPLLHALSNFGSMDDLTEKIHDIFREIDVNGSGGLTQDELSQGLRWLSVSPMVVFTEEDWNIMTDNMERCNEDGEIDMATFENVVKTELREFMKRQIGAQMPAVCRNDMSTETILFTLKTLMFSDDDALRRGKRDVVQSFRGSGDTVAGDDAAASDEGSEAVALRLDAMQQSFDRRLGALQAEVRGLSSKLDAVASVDAKLGLLLRQRQKSGPAR